VNERMRRTRALENLGRVAGGSEKILVPTHRPSVGNSVRQRPCTLQLGKDSNLMLHFTCDLCSRELSDERYVVRIEVYPGFDPEEVDEEQLDADHLQAISEALQEVEETGKLELEDCGTKAFRFDLCPRCHKKFVKDPLGRDALRRLNFSEN
jgi:hypothetical protein